jgi:hypothetical protein
MNRAQIAAKDMPTTHSWTHLGLVTLKKEGFSVRHQLIVEYLTVPQQGVPLSKGAVVVPKKRPP